MTIRKNEWMNERTNERANERTNEWMNEWKMSKNTLYQFHCHPNNTILTCIFHRPTTWDDDFPRVLPDPVVNSCPSVCLPHSHQGDLDTGTWAELPTGLPCHADTSPHIRHLQYGGPKLGHQGLCKFKCQNVKCCHQVQKIINCNIYMRFLIIFVEQ